MRPDNRTNGALRAVSFERNYTKHAEGSVLVAFGDTRVLCTASVESRVPPFLRNTGSGWVTAEYNMLPRSTNERIGRNAVNKGRALEISRLIGRSLRNVIQLGSLGEQQIIVDCDVLQADGGTRTAAITGAYIALHDALDYMLGKELITELPLIGQCAAISVGIVKGELLLDLCYEEDSTADVDLNLVMRSDKTIIELQGCAEGEAFPRATLDQLLDLAESGIQTLFDLQKKALDCD